MVICPAGHASDEPDYCSICGAPVRPGAATTPVAAPVAAVAGASAAMEAPLACPLCGESRGLPPAMECAICCYPFAPAQPARWWLEVAIDPALDDEPDPATPCPGPRPAVAVAVEGDEVMVGRHDAAPRPAVAVHDPGASRRHARFVRAGEGLAVEDLGSTNGTRRGGAELAPHTPVAVRDGDTVTLGRWTRITVRERGER